MNFEQAYQKYLILSESNGTTDNLSTSKGSFTVKFNIAQNKLIEWFIENNSSDENRYLQKIKIPFLKLQESENKLQYTSYSLPPDYFEHIDLEVRGTKGKCANELLSSREVKSENVSKLLTDIYSKPSFKFRETFYTISDNKVQVYKDQFETSANISYYRYPVQIELENPDNPESQFKNLQVEFDDKLTNRIILSTVALYELSSDDPKYQAFKQETVQKF